MMEICAHSLMNKGSMSLLSYIRLYSPRLQASGSGKNCEERAIESTRIDTSVDNPVST